MAASLASATQSRVESASKHIVPCKMNYDYMSDVMPDDRSANVKRMTQDHMRYSLNKDDLAIGLGRQAFPNQRGHAAKHSAHPSVVACFTDTSIAFQKLLAARYHSEQLYMDYRDFYMNKDVEKFERNFTHMYCVGVSLGLACIHPSKGDTVASVMIGGLKTILNGAFPVHTNDLLMFYWPCEKDYFDASGQRKEDNMLGNQNDKPSSSENSRQIYHRGKMAKTSHGDTAGLCVPHIKPYLVKMGADVNSWDASRVFAKAMSNAQPWEQVDIMISRQSL